MSSVPLVSSPGFFAKERTVAGHAFSRWLVPPAALAIHLCIGMASPLLQEVFGGQLIGVTASFDQLTPAQLSSIAAIAAGFTGLLSLFNIAGRIFWASL